MQQVQMLQSASTCAAAKHSVSETFPANELFCNNIVGKSIQFTPSWLGIVPVRLFPETSK